jgi:hypothetical protein
LLKELSQSCLLLQKLSIRGCSSVTDAGIMEILNCSLLSSLGISLSLFFHFSPSLSHYFVIDMSAISTISQYIYYEIPHKLKFITKLAVSAHLNFNASALNFLLANARLLRHVEATMCGIFDYEYFNFKNVHVAL